MKNFMNLSLLIGIIVIMALNSCKKDPPTPTPDPEPTDKFGVFKEYLIDNNLDIPNVLDAWITTSTVVYENMEDGDASNDFYIIDIRSAEDFAAGHIEGAVNSSLGSILDAASLSGGKPIIVACYTGQTASHAVVALRLSGYANAKVLKWGMCSWNPNTASSWQGNIGNGAIGNTNWKYPAGPAGNIEFGDPTIETTAETGENILKERVAALLTGGMNKISNAEVLASPGDYFINNYWEEVDNTHYGHIDGAYRILPMSLANGEYKYLNQSATIVTYCWTGQTSSMLTAYLKVLGYNTKSLLFGANGMIHENLESHKWTDDAIMDYPLVQSELPHEGFGILKEYLIDNNMDMTTVIDGWITSSTAVYDNMNDGDTTNDFFIIDIRAAEDYTAGHIEGAVNSPLADILITAEAANGHPVLVACYTGQTASHAVIALRLSGYSDAKVLKWGMSSWNAATSGAWLSNIGNAAIGHANWTPAPGSISGNIEFGDPSFETTATNGETMLAERVGLLLNGGMNKITNADVLTSPSDYFINNFWEEADVQHYGNITGAYRLKPLSLANGEYKFINPAATVVTYCWTGQTSSMVTAYLKIIGYNSKSLLFGTNGMIHENLESHKFTEAETKDYPLVSE